VRPSRKPLPAPTSKPLAAEPPFPGYRCGRIGVVGRPNVGKSTLVNALVGARITITSRRPQTTRQRVAGIVTTPSAQFIFVDTPGFQTEHRSGLNERMNRTVRESIGGVDAVLWVVEALKLTPADRNVLQLIGAATPVVVAVNKIDRVDDKSRLLPFLGELAALRDFTALVPVSAEKGKQLDDLLKSLEPLLPEQPREFEVDDVTDRDERFLAAEFIREKIFRSLGEEIPYRTTVAVESFEHKDDLRHIQATIYVDRANQRAILLGKDGERIKAIGTEARRDMEQLFGGRVYLELWVRVKGGWTDDERMLDRLGF